VVPIFQEERSIPPFLKKLQPLLEKTASNYEIIFCLDPSPDRSEDILVQANREDSRVRFLLFSRRFGQPMATLAGLEYSSGEAVIVMDVDMQDPPDLVPAMIHKWREGYDVVIPQRTSRTGEPWVKRVISWIGYRIINRIADVPIPPHTGDFRLLSRRVVSHLVELKEHHGFLRGMVALVGFRQCLIPFERPARNHGQTKYNKYLGSLKIGLNGVFCFSSYALTLASTTGFLIAGVSLLLGVVYAALKILGFPFPLGNPTIVILVLFMCGIQLIGIGILGGYIARIYDEVRERPKFIIEKAAGFTKRKNKK